MKKMGKSKNWVIWCRSRKKDEEQHPFEVDGKQIFSYRSKQTKAKAGEKMDNKQATSSQCAGKSGGDRATSNAQSAKCMLRVGFTKNAMWQMSKKQL